MIGGLVYLVKHHSSLYTLMCEKARWEAFAQMLDHAGDMGENHIVGERYDANEVIAGITEVLAYRTVVVEVAQSDVERRQAGQKGVVRWD